MGTRERLLETLRKNGVMILATSTPGGVPHAAAVFFAVDDDLTFYFMTRETTKKGKHLRENRNVAFVIGIEPPFSVQGAGKAVRIRDEADKRTAMRRIAQIASLKKDLWPPILRIKNGEYQVFRIVPRAVRVLDLENKQISPATSPFYEIRLR